MILILEVSESGILSIATSLSVVLSSRLPIHLEDATTRFSNHSPHKRDIVDGACRGGSLVALVDTLQSGTEEPLRFSEYFGRLF